MQCLELLGIKDNPHRSLSAPSLTVPAPQSILFSLCVLARSGFSLFLGRFLQRGMLETCQSCCLTRESKTPSLGGCFPQQTPCAEGVIDLVLGEETCASFGNLELMHCCACCLRGVLSLLGVAWLTAVTRIKMFLPSDKFPLSTKSLILCIVLRLHLYNSSQFLVCTMMEKLPCPGDHLCLGSSCRFAVFMMSVVEDWEDANLLPLALA